MSDFGGFKSQAEESRAEKFYLICCPSAQTAEAGLLQEELPTGRGPSLRAGCPPFQHGVVVPPAPERVHSPSHLSVRFLTIFAQGSPLVLCLAEALGFYTVSRLVPDPAGTGCGRVLAIPPQPSLRCFPLCAPSHRTSCGVRQTWILR